MAAAAACVLVALVGVLNQLYVSYRKDVNLASKGALVSSRMTFDSLVRKDTEMMSAVLDSVASRRDVRRAFAQGDTKKLLEITEPLARRLRERYGITHLYFHDPNGKVVLRVHKPTARGDLPDRASFRAARKTGGYGSGLELGETAYALRVVHPVYETSSTAVDLAMEGDPEDLIGYIEIAEEIGHFVGSLKQRTGDEVGLLLLKSSVDRSEWARMRASNGVPDDWSDRKSYVLAGTTSVEWAAQMDLEQEAPDLPRAGMPLGLIDGPGDRTMAAGVYPVRDTSGNQFGAIYVLHDLTPFVQGLMWDRLVIAAVVILSGVLLGIALWMSLNRLVFRRLHVLQERATVKRGYGVIQSLSTPTAAVRQDEIAQFETELLRDREELGIKSMLLDEASDAIVVHDLSGKVLYANEAASAGWGYAPDELREVGLAGILTGSGLHEMSASMDRVIRTGNAIFESEILSKDGHIRPIEVHARTVEVEGEVAIASIVRDLTERRAAERTIERLAYYDSVTGLANRQSFQNRLTAALSAAKRLGECIAVIYVDLDRLKNVNDSLGHSIGDEVIAIVGDRLVEVIGEREAVARVGGDEYVVLLLDTNDRASEEKALQILDALKPSIRLGRHVIHVSASLGIAMCEGGCESGETLIRQADMAMYSCKRLGGDAYCFFSQDMSDEVREHFELQTELRVAFEADQLMLHYQPQMRTSDGRAMGVEALLRWTNPKRGPVPPSVFIPLAEESGLILQLGDWVLRRACAQAKQWHDQGLMLRMAVNMSVRQLLHPDVVESVRSALVDSGMDAEYLELEITEGIALRHSQQTTATLAALQGLGVRIAVDDFGTGYSSLSRVTNLPIDCLKIDRSFIEQMNVQSETMAIVNTIISLAKRLDLETIAEGVETREQLEALRAMGCAEAQGFFFSPPVPPEKIPGIVSPDELIA